MLALSQTTVPTALMASVLAIFSAHTLPLTALGQATAGAEAEKIKASTNDPSTTAPAAPHGGAIQPTAAEEEPSGEGGQDRAPARPALPAMPEDAASEGTAVKDSATATTATPQPPVAAHLAPGGAPAGSDRPAPKPMGLALGLSLDRPWYTDRSNDVFDNDDVSERFGLWLGYELLGLRGALGDLGIGLHLGWNFEDHGADGRFGGLLDSQLDTHFAYGGVDARWKLLSWLQPQLRLAGGAGFSDMVLSMGGERFKDDAISAYGSAGLGLLLRSPEDAFGGLHGGVGSLGFGLLFEGGYSLASPLSLRLDGPGPKKHEIDLAEADLGELERSGPYFRTSLLVSY